MKHRIPTFPQEPYMFDFDASLLAVQDAVVEYQPDPGLRSDLTTAGVSQTDPINRINMVIDAARNAAEKHLAGLLAPVLVLAQSLETNDTMNFQQMHKIERMIDDVQMLMGFLGDTRAKRYRELRIAVKKNKRTDPMLALRLNDTAHRLENLTNYEMERLAEIGDMLKVVRTLKAPDYTQTEFHSDIKALRAELHAS